MGRYVVLKNRVLCSRPLLALHVLMGRPVAYRVRIAAPFVCDDNEGARVAECTIWDYAQPAPSSRPEER
jgi:hypothetical protein